ncbi:MAG: NrfD/PsrC family molybdoenzyme membrane anchor subunit [Raoultibacter sp.]
MLGDLVVCYLFLGGAGAGATLLLFVFGLLTPDALVRTSRQGRLRVHPQRAYRRFFAFGFVAAALALLLGTIFLLEDVGRVDRLLLLLLQPSASFLSIGAVSLTALILLSGFFAWMWCADVARVPHRLVRCGEIGGIVLSLAVIVYTGLLLQSVRAIALWASPFVPVLFVLSSLSTGIALIMATMYLTGSARYYATTLARLARIDMIVIAIEGVCLAVFSAVVFNDALAGSSAQTMIFGEHAVMFWCGLVLFGLIVPFVVEALSGHKGSGYLMLASSLVLVGGFCLRWCIANAGIAPDVVASAMVGLGW